ncbi:hypothetical protein AAVH_08187 [Aphelenchoides avenae]|nr:hypothetical protein AAVH_08187 [Aphelenchus avenae]
MVNNFDDLRYRHRCCGRCDAETAALFISIVGLAVYFAELQPLGVIAHMTIAFGWLRQNPKWYRVYIVLSYAQVVVLFAAAVLFLFLAIFSGTKGEVIGKPLLVIALVTLAVQLWFIEVIRRAKVYLEEKNRLKHSKTYIITFRNPPYAGYYMPYAVQNALYAPAPPPAFYPPMTYPRV